VSKNGEPDFGFDGAEPAVSQAFLDELYAAGSRVEAMTDEARDAYAKELARKHGVAGNVTGAYVLYLLKHK